MPRGRHTALTISLTPEERATLTAWQHCLCTVGNIYDSEWGRLKMNVENELISVSLEIVAFFFVTVDLYGKERLDRLTVLLLSVMESISKKIQRLVERLIGGVINNIFANYEKLKEG